MVGNEKSEGLKKVKQGEGKGGKTRSRGIHGSKPLRIASTSIFDESWAARSFLLAAIRTLLELSQRTRPTPALPCS